MQQRLWARVSCLLATVGVVLLSSLGAWGCGLPAADNSTGAPPAPVAPIAPAAATAPAAALPDAPAEPAATGGPAAATAVTGVPAVEAAPARPFLTRPVLKEVVIADYAKGLEASGAKSGDAAVTVTADAGGLTAVFAARSNNVPAVLFGAAPVDVTGLDFVRCTITNTGSGRVQSTFYFGNDKTAGIGLPLDPGANEILFPLSDPTTGAAVTQIAQVRLTVARQTDAATLKVGSIKAVKLFTDRAKLRCFDFGPGALFLGATPIKNEITGDAKLDYTCTGTGFQGYDRHAMFPLFGDGLEATDLKLIVANLAGDYEVQTVAFGTNWQGARTQSYKITAGDQAVVDVPVTKENFYTYDNQYYGANIFYDPTKPLFDQYHRGFFKPARFEATAKDHQVAIGFDHCGVYALWMYPKALAEEGRAFVEGCYAEEAYGLWLKTARVREHAPNANAAAVPAEDQAHGYTLFARYYQDRVYPNYAPTALERLNETGVAIHCAPGEIEPATFTVRPLKDLGLTKVTVNPVLLGETKLSPITCELFTIKYFPQEVAGLWYEPIPTTLYPYAAGELKNGWNTQYWISVKVPPGTPAGKYTGSIAVEPANGTRSDIPFTVTVYPFDLAPTTTECGMWNNTALQSHLLTAFPENDAYTTKVLDAECKDMVEHGLNGYCLGGITASKMDAEKHTATLDFSKMDLLIAATQRAGMHGRHMLDVQGFATYGLMRHGFPEFSDGFNAAYIDGLTQLRDWIQKNHVPVVVQLTDEPRETELNEWNRNLKDTIKYCKLAREVTGLPTLVTIMSDKGAFGRPYAPIVPMVDVMATHSWPGSDDIIYLAAEDHMADYWAYNNGFNRFAHGFYLWKIRALGHWQWVYSWEICEAHIPVFFAHDSSAAYAVPGGFLDTIKYEDVREGIDDHRYLEMLTAQLKSAAANNPAKAPAQEFLQTLEKFLPQYPAETGLETGAEAGGVYSESQQNRYFAPWREQIAEYITALQANRAPGKVDAAWAMFPVQAKEEDRAVVCTLIDKAQAPTIDGKGDDACWKNAREIGDFVDLAKGRLAAVQSKVKTVCDGENIYFLFTCIEPKYGELKGYAINRDEDTWEDDSIEVFMDTAFDRKTYKHVSVNCLGTVQDEDTRDVLWNAATKTAVQKTKGTWTVELAVSVKDLGGKLPADGVTWGVNLCRNRQPQPSETSSWAFVGHSFHNPAKFGTLRFSK